MKKICTLLLSGLLIISSTFAEITFSKRVVEMGVNASVSANQNLLGVFDILKETVVIDLPKIADGMTDDGLVINAGTDDSFYANFNLKKFGLGLDVGVDGNVSIATGKGFMDFLAYGNPSGYINTNFVVSGEMFVDVTQTVRLQVGSLKLRFTPTYYIPIMYIPTTYVPVTVVSTTDTNFKATANGDVSVYSVVNIAPLFTGDMDILLDDLSTGYLDLMSCGGLSLGVEAELPLLPKLAVGAYANVPIVPGSLKYKTSVEAEFEASMDNILGSMLSGSMNPDISYSFTPKGTSACNYSVNKPLRLGGDLVYKPFGKWFVINPMVGVACRNPFGEDFTFKDSFFLEYGCSARMNLLGMFTISASTSYIDKVFAHQAGLGLNLYIAEVNLKVGTSGTDFLSSFNISGLKALVGVTIGL